MIGNRTPRLLLLAVALGVTVSGVMLSVFYGQYRWLADQIVDASSAEYNELAEANFEQKSSSQLQLAANGFLDLPDDELASGVFFKLNTILLENRNLTGVRFVDDSGQAFDAGSFPQSPQFSDTTWLEQRLLIAHPVVVNDIEVGKLLGAFDIAELDAMTARFTEEITNTEIESLRIS
jgi:hypothetical protein